LLDGELDELVPKCRALDLDARNRDRQLEPSGARTAWIQKKHASAYFSGGMVRVPGYDSLETCSARVKIESLELVHHIEKAGSYLKNLGDWQGLGPRTLVVVTSHRGDWCDSRKTIQDVGRADVTGMNDEVGSRERLDSLGSEETVGVRDDADCAPHLAV